jgi:2-succinyl-6-hydroxy-2,4-cyclohexadiene-1-carboxylate synthase
MPELQPNDGRPSIWFETKGERSNDPLLLLHGFTGTHRTWDDLVERLAEKHFLMLLDLPGHGRSGTSPSRAKMGLGPTSDTVADLVRLNMGDGGGRKPVILGYSLGGRVALDLACGHQELLSGLILEGASPGIERDEEREERRAKDDALADEIERRGLEWFVDYWQDTPLFATQKDLPPRDFEGIRRDRLSNSARGLAMSLRGAGTGEMVPLWDKLENLRIPVLFVVGERDRRYAQTGEAMRRRIPRSVVAEVEAAGHCVHVERPEEFADLVERFLEDRSAAMPAARSEPQA